MPLPSLVVFVCGTYSDLLDERAKVLEALQRLRLRHESMEFFGARPEAPIQACLEEVRQSDLLIVIVGYRYGSLVPGTDFSFTETEYNEGFQLGKPCFVYIRDDQVRILPQQVEQSQVKLERLRAFRETLEFRHTVFHFRDPGALALQISVDLNNSMTHVEDAKSALRLLQRGVDAWNAWRTGNAGSSPVLRSVDLRGMQLEGCNFSGINLESADFTGAQLRAANFQNADLHKAKFEACDLSFAQFQRADLTGAIILESQLGSARLTEATLLKTLIIDSILKDVDLECAVLGGTKIINSNLDGVMGLETCTHQDESSLDFHTLKKSQSLPIRFMRSIGLPERFTSIFRRYSSRKLSSIRASSAIPLAIRILQTGYMQISNPKEYGVGSPRMTFGPA